MSAGRRVLYLSSMLSQKPWRLEAVIQLIAGVLGCLCFGVLTAGLLGRFGVAGFRTPDSFGGVLVATLSFQGAAWGMIWIFLRQHGVGWREAIGWNRPALGRALLLAAGLLVVLLPLVLGLEKGSAWALEQLGYPPEDQRAVDLFAHSGSGLMRAYLALFAVVLAPVAEEFIFRGVLHPFIKQLGWPRLAWLGTSFLFALIHLNAPTFVPLLVLAMAFTWLYEKTDCLLAPIAAHSLFNGVNLVILLAQN